MWLKPLQFLTISQKSDLETEKVCFTLPALVGADFGFAWSQVVISYKRSSHGACSSQQGFLTRLLVPTCNPTFTYTDWFLSDVIPGGVLAGELTCERPRWLVSQSPYCKTFLWNVNSIRWIFFWIGNKDLTHAVLWTITDSNFCRAEWKQKYLQMPWEL